MSKLKSSDVLSIGEVVKRAGIPASALRYYESRGLIQSLQQNQQRRFFQREVLRRLAFIKAAQTAGLSLDEITAALASLPQQRTPTKQDWQRLSKNWQSQLQTRIDALLALRDQLDSCIGCGCLSLRSCALYNHADQLGQKGAGPRILMGDKAELKKSSN